MKRFDGYALDLDGTVYLGDELLPGAAATVQALREAGARVVFATNRPLDTAAHYAAKLTRLGIPAEERDVVTAVDALVRYLRAHHAGRSLLLIAEEVVAERLRCTRDSSSPRAPSDAEVVVVSFDRTFDYAKLHAAFRAVRENGAAIVATNPDPYCPTPDGGLPDCAAMLAALEACTGARAEAIVGKPSRHMAGRCSSAWASTPRAPPSSATGWPPTWRWPTSSAPPGSSCSAARRMPAPS